MIYDSDKEEPSIHKKSSFGLNGYLLKRVIDPEKVNLLKGADAFELAGIPPSYASKLEELSNETNVLIGIRTDKAGSTPRQRWYLIYSPKATSCHTKSTVSETPDRGYIAYTSDARDMTDHVHDEQPESATTLDINEHKDIFKHIKAADPNNAVQEQLVGAYQWKGRLYYRIERNKFRMYDDDCDTGEANYTNSSGRKFMLVHDKSGNRAKQIDNYIQCTESLGNILDRARNGHYIDLKIKGDILTYTSIHNKRTYQINLKQLSNESFHENEDSHYKEKHELERFKSDSFTVNDGKVQRSKIPQDVLVELAQRDIDLSLEAPVSVITKAPGKAPIITPLLVFADPYPITGDIDTFQIGAPTAAVLQKILKDNKIEQSIIDKLYKIYDLTKYDQDDNKNPDLLTKRDFIGFVKDLQIAVNKNEALKNNPIFRAFAVSPNDDLSYFDKMQLDPDKYGSLEKYGCMSGYEFLVSTMLNLETKSQLLQHGPESKNPRDTPEIFKAVLFVYKGESIHVNNEESCLHFYFYHKDLLKDNFIEIHPTWLLGENKEKWLDIIKLQIKYGMEAQVKSSITALMEKQTAYTKVPFKEILNEILSLKQDNLNNVDNNAKLEKLKDDYHCQAVDFFKKNGIEQVNKENQSKTPNRRNNAT